MSAHEKALKMARVKEGSHIGIELVINESQVRRPNH